MKDTYTHVGHINSQLKAIKSATQTECFCPIIEGISILTNIVSSNKDFTIISNYIKTIEEANINNSSFHRLPQSNLKIIGILFIQSDSTNLNSEKITNYLKNIDLFDKTNLVSKPYIIKVSSKFDIAIV